MLPQFGDSRELLVSVRVRIAGELLVIDAKREDHLFEQSGDRPVADLDTDTEVVEFCCDLGRGPTGPLKTAQRIASRLMLHDRLDPGDYFRHFFHGSAACS